MKLSDTVTNLGTALLTATVAAFVAGYNRLELNVNLPTPELQTLVLAIVSILALANLTGLPKKLVEDQWENSVFGEKFLPIVELDNRHKRKLAGLIEVCAIVLTLTERPLFRAGGYGVIVIMYGRGAMVNTRVRLEKALFTLMVAVIAGVLMLVELQSPSVEEE